MYRLRNPEQVAITRKKYRDKHRLDQPEKPMFRRARLRARELGLPFDIELSDVVIPARCPILGIPLRIGKGKLSDNSPSLDRVVPRKGYVKGNVVVVSFRVNRMKSDATVQELRKITDFYERHQRENC